MTTTYWDTVYRKTRYTPTTITITQTTSRTRTVRSSKITATTTTIPTTATVTTITTSTYYAACATGNLLSEGPDGNTIINVYNNGLKSTSNYDVAQGTFNNAYECCARCQEGQSCTGSVFRTEDNVCLLLHNNYGRCNGGQCENEAVYVTAPNKRRGGLVVSNGPCGYLKYGGAAQPGIPHWGCRAPGPVEEYLSEIY